MRLKDRRKILHIKAARIITLFILIVFFGSAYLSFSENVQIKNIQVTGNKNIKTEEMQKIIFNQVSGKYFWLFSKSNIFLYPKKKIISELKSANLRILSTKIKMDNFTDITVDIIERKEYATWCNKDIQCFYIDDTGLIFEKSILQNDNYIKFTGSIKETSNYLGKYLLKNNFKKMKQFITAFHNSNYSPTDINIKNDGVFNVIVTSTPKILLHIESNPDKIIKNFKTVLGNKLKNENLNNIEYIDLRFGNKIYIKRKTSDI